MRKTGGAGTSPRDAISACNQGRGGTFRKVQCYDMCDTDSDKDDIRDLYDAQLGSATTSGDVKEDGPDAVTESQRTVALSQLRTFSHLNSMM